MKKKKVEAKVVNFVSTELQLKDNNREDCKGKVNIWTRQKNETDSKQKKETECHVGFRYLHSAAV